ncbi:NAD kinase [Azorhizobium doebereinerae]|uniref:NAD kinase n=1 Tax=Azorhizobium doebereinerae TaxID=281091 RepID=UPI0004182E63|nr:NAD kinase [Azorhizobium doebereinerae]
MTDSPRRFERIAFAASQTSEAEAARARLIKRYGAVEEDAADVIVALGGDGLMLQTLHRFRDRGVPIYGMHRGSVGFLMNTFREDDLHGRLAAATHVIIHPLVMTALDVHGVHHTAPAINEVSLLRQTYQAAKLRISIDGKVRLEELICDGILVATPAGSTAYNLSAHGPILPLSTALLALTPISPFRPRRWRGALLPDRATIQITVLEADKRPVSAVADHQEVRDIVEVSAHLDKSSSMDMLFDPDHGLDERILREQFIY